MGPSPSEATTPIGTPQFVELVKELQSAVVNISTEKTLHRPEGRSRPEGGEEPLRRWPLEDFF
ncbi:MAG: hypothetical protein ACRD1Z_12610, partial [Vicinamibacteria bacterium]